MIILLNILMLLGLALAGYRLSAKSKIIAFYWPGLIFKIAAGIVLGLLYLQYYPSGDTWVMFKEALKLEAAATNSFKEFSDIYLFSNYSSISDFSFSIQPRAAFMTKILAVLAFFTNQSYWLSACYLSMFSFFGFWFAANTVYKIFNSKLMAVLPTLFFPSIVFWSSGVLKESVAISSLVVVMGILTKVYYKRRINWLDILLLALGLVLVLYLKYYYAAVLIVSFASLFFARLILNSKSKWYLELGAILLIFAIILGIASITHPNFWPSRFLNVMVDNYYQFLYKSPAENVVIFSDLSPTISSFLFHSPKALFVGLFFPLGMTSFSLLKLASVAENWLIIISFVYAVRWFKIPEWRDDRLILWAMLLFVFVLAIFITFSTPNLGTLVRFKIGYLFVFITIISGAISNNLG